MQPGEGVDVFWATPREPRAVDHLLVDSDREHLDWLRHDRARSESATARALLRGALAARFGLPPADVSVTRTCPSCGRPHGRPVDPALGVFLSASHTDGRVIVAITDVAPVGVDVEWVIPDRMVGLGVSTAEWTRREAFFKSTGSAGAFDAESVAGGGRHVNVGAGYCAAVYLEGDVRPPITVTAADDLLSAWAASPRTTTA